MADIIEDIKEKVEEGLEEAKEILEEGAENIKETAGEIVEKVKEGITSKTDIKSKDKIKKKSSKAVKKELDETPEFTEDSLIKNAEEESLKTEKSIEEKGSEKNSPTSSANQKDLDERKKALLEKVAKLKGKLTEAPKTEDLKEQIKIKKREDMLIQLEEYVKSGIYLGTRVVTPDMKPFVYRRRADGLAIFNTDLIDEKLKEGVEYLSKFEAKDIILVCKRQAGWKVADMFGEITGIRVFTKKYPAGILTNTTLPNFFENELTIVTDSWLDKNALNDTLNINKKVLMICDTNNFSKGASQIIIGNNKSPKSLGVIFYLLAKGYCKAKGIEANIPELDWWMSGEEEAPKKRSSLNVGNRKFSSRSKFRR
jgi:ribosomal protein uS2